MTCSEDQIESLRLYRTENVGPVVYRQLLDKFKTPQRALKEVSKLAQYGGRKGPLTPPKRADIEKEIAALEKIGGKFIFTDSQDYPPLFKHVSDAPPIFSCLKYSHLLSQPQIAIVGARNASSQARKLAENFAYTLSHKHAYVITSGMARGVDTAAHQGALRDDEGATIAVLASGIDQIYPRENQELYERIAQQGCIISEAPFASAAQARHFPRRNRIISALSIGVLVVEAALNSGSLITARLAGEQGREVFAVPGSPLDARCRGCNSLLRDGAVLTETPDDIVEHLNRQLNFSETWQREYQELPLLTASSVDEISDKLRHVVLNLLSPSATDIDSIIRDSKANVESVMTVLMELELAGRVERHPGHRVALTWDNMSATF